MNGKTAKLLRRLATVNELDKREFFKNWDNLTAAQKAAHRTELLKLAKGKATK